MKILNFLASLFVGLMLFSFTVSEELFYSITAHVEGIEMRGMVMRPVPPSPGTPQIFLNNIGQLEADSDSTIVLTITDVFTEELIITEILEVGDVLAEEFLFTVLGDVNSLNDTLIVINVNDNIEFPCAVAISRCLESNVPFIIDSIGTRSDFSDFPDSIQLISVVIRAIPTNSICFDFPEVKQFFTNEVKTCSEFSNVEAFSDTLSFDSGNDIVVEKTIVDTLFIDECSKTILKTLTATAFVTYELDTFFDFGQYPELIVAPITIDTSFILYQYIDTIKLIDTTVPIFTYVPPNGIVNCEEFDLDNYAATASDDCGEALMISSTVSSSIEPSGNTIHQIIWTAEDACGNTVMDTTTITELNNCSTSTCDSIIMVSSNEDLSINYRQGTNLNLKLYRIGENDSWQLVATCIGEGCNNPQMFSNLETGKYIVDYQLFNADWQLICEEQRAININNTIPSNPCADIQIEIDISSISINNLNAAFLDIQVYNKDWLEVYKCINGECQNPLVVEGLASGNYNIITKLYDQRADGGWDFICERSDLVDVPVTAQSRTNTEYDFDFYPNPARAELYVNMENYLGKSATIRISNLMSKEVFYQQIPKVTSITERISLAGIDNGLYIIDIQGEGRPLFGKKLMISKLY